MTVVGIDVAYPLVVVIVTVIVIIKNTRLTLQVGLCFDVFSSVQSICLSSTNVLLNHHYVAECFLNTVGIKLGNA